MREDSPDTHITPPGRKLAVSEAATEYPEALRSLWSRIFGEGESPC